MKPHRKLAETRTPDGAVLTLFEHDGSFSIRLNGQALMHSTMHASELALGELATAKIGKAGAPRVLIGGLGLGFTLRRVLQRVSPKARVIVAELLPEIVAWNREFMAALNGELLDDSRVEVVAGDVGKLIGAARGPGRYDAILLDIDNGPTALVQRGNQRLYDEAGIQRLVTALQPGGRAAIWSAAPDRAFADRLKKAGFSSVEAVPARLHATAKRSACTIYVADRAPAAPAIAKGLAQLSPPRPRRA